MGSASGTGDQRNSANIQQSSDERDAGPRSTTAKVMARNGTANDGNSVMQSHFTRFASVKPGSQVLLPSISQATYRLHERILLLPSEQRLLVPRTRVFFYLRRCAFQKFDFRRASTITRNKVIKWCEKDPGFLLTKNGPGARSANKEAKKYFVDNSCGV